MSGGAFEYRDRYIHDFIEEIERNIKNNGIEDETGYSSNYSKKVLEKFTNAIELLKISVIYLHRIDWLLSGDDSNETFLERLDDDLDKFNKSKRDV